MKRVWVSIDVPGGGVGFRRGGTSPHRALKIPTANSLRHKRLLTRRHWRLRHCRNNYPFSFRGLPAHICRWFNDARNWNIPAHPGWGCGQKELICRVTVVGGPELLQKGWWWLGGTQVAFQIVLEVMSAPPASMLLGVRHAAPIVSLSVTVGNGPCIAVDLGIIAHLAPELRRLIIDCP